MDEINVAAAHHVAVERTIGTGDLDLIHAICGILRPGCSAERTTLPENAETGGATVELFTRSNNA